MISPNLVRNAVNKRVRDNLPADITVTIFDNEPYAKPAPPWIRAVLRHQGREQETIGSNPRFRVNGSVFIQIFTKLGEGANDADDIAYGMASAFDISPLDVYDFSSPAQKVGRILFAPAVSREGPNEGDLNTGVVEVPFHYYQQGEASSS